MITSILGQKKEMSYRYDDRGHRIPVTAVWVEPNKVIGVRTIESDGYSAWQLGIGQKKRTGKAIMGHLKKMLAKDQKVDIQEIKAPKYTREVKVDPQDSQNIPLELQVQKILHKGLLVKVTGVSKGRGFAGVVKRWGFAGGPKTHGQSDRLRAPGSIGQGTTPGRVYKGKHMAGHMGNAQVTVSGLEVVEVDRGNNVVFLKGTIPGYMGGLVKLTITGKVKAYQPPPEEKIDEEEEPKEKTEQKVEKQEKEAEEPADKEVIESKKEDENAS